MTSSPSLDAIDLSALMCSRILHDMITPVSATSNALGVMTDPSAEDMHEEALALVRGSVMKSRAVLEFLRIAFGFGGALPGKVDAAELWRVTSQLYGETKHEVIWNVEAPALDKTAARVLLNLVLLGVEAVPRGGTVTVEVDAEGRRLRVSATGRRVLLAKHVVPGLSLRTPADKLEPQSIHPYFTGLLSRSVGEGAVVEYDEENRHIAFQALVDAKHGAPVVVG